MSCNEAARASNIERMLFFIVLNGLWFTITLEVAATHVVDPSVMLPAGEISQVALVAMRLALKRDVAVGIAPHGEAYEPLNEIEYVEKHEQHLALLGSVDALMVHQLIAQIHARVHKQHTQQVDGSESPEWQYGRPHNFHCGKGTTFFPYPGCTSVKDPKDSLAAGGNAVKRVKKMRKTRFITAEYCTLAILKYLCAQTMMLT